MLYILHCGVFFQNILVSLMDVVLTVEGMGVTLAVLNTLDLDGRVVEVVLSAAHICDG